jgi:hypothetical protein
MSRLRDREALSASSIYSIIPASMTHEEASCVMVVLFSTIDGTILTDLCAGEGYDQVGCVAEEEAYEESPHDDFRRFKAFGYSE